MRDPCGHQSLGDFNKNVSDVFGPVGAPIGDVSGGEYRNEQLLELQIVHEFSPSFGCSASNVAAAEEGVMPSSNADREAP